MPAFFKTIWPLGPTDKAVAAIVFIALLSYLYGLSNPYAPTNGDEMVYTHIARMTAESGHWLALQSEIVGTRNTKPPLLIWQAIVAGNWGQNWSLGALRLPSVLYTFATTAFLGFFAFRISGRMATAWTAAAVYLLFFSTFRYGRVYLTSAPETFWLALPMWWLLWQSLRIDGKPMRQDAALGWRSYTAFGLAFGLGALYKSFALIAPAAAALWCAILLSAPQLCWRRLWSTTLGVCWSGALGLSLFALWFAIDPDPAAVWQEFILAENAGKMSGSQGYWHAAFFGAYPMWTQLIAYPENAGLLFFVAMGLIVAVLRPAFQKQSYAKLLPHHWVLLAWLAVWLVIFTLPSQRSARYVIPAMPALAIVTALLWDRIGRPWFWITLLIATPALVMLARIGWVMGTLEIANPAQVAVILTTAGTGLVFVAGGFVKSWCKQATLCSVLAVYVTFGALIEPLSAKNNGYAPGLSEQLQAQQLAVPNGFTGQFERFHFAFPGAKITPYDAEGRNTGAFEPDLPSAQRLSYLLGKFGNVIWIQDNLSQIEPGCLPDCTLLGSRWHIKSRHKSGEVNLKNIWFPDQWLFRQEWLIQSKTTQNGASNS